MRAAMGLALALVLSAGTAQAAGRLRVASAPATVEFDRAVVRGFGKQLGLEVEPVPSQSLEDALSALNAGKADVVTGLRLVGGEKPSGLAVSVEVLPTRFVGVTLGSADPAAFIESLRGRRLASIRGEGVPRLLTDAKVTQARLGEVASPKELLDELRAAKAEVGILSMEEAMWAQAQERELRFGAFIGPRFSLVYVVRDRALLPSLDAYLSQLRSTPTWGILLVKHLGPASLDLMRKARLAQ